MSKNIDNLPSAKPQLKEVNEIAKDTWNIVLPKTRIHTLDQLLDYFKVDLDVWEVERFVANKWEMGYKDAAGKPGVEQLYQVKAFLRRKRFATLEGYVKDNAKLRAQVEKLRHDVSAERAVAKTLAFGHAGHDELLGSIKEYVKALGEIRFPTSKAKPQRAQVVPPVSEGHTEDAVMVWSDLHFGDRIRCDDTSGFPEFDLEIAANRFGYVVDKCKQVLSLHRAMYPIERLYVPILGDIGNGELWDAPKSNVLFLPAQVHFSYHMLRFGIEDLLELVDGGVVKKLVLLFSVGNHMRVDEKMPMKYQAQRTLDWLIYQFVIERFRGDKRIEIKEEISPFIFQDIRGHRYLFTHGYQVGYKNRPETQARSMSQFISLVRALFDSPVYRKKAGLSGETFSRAVIGDIHVPVSFPRLISNGSLNGQNELGVSWALEPIPAGQQLFGVSRSHIETWKYFLECTEVQRENPNSYALFAREYMAKFGR